MDAVSRNCSPGGLDTGRAAAVRRDPHRPPGVGPQRAEHLPGGQAGRASPRRSARHPLGVPWVARRRARHAVGQFMGVGLSDDDCSGTTQAADHGRVGVGREASERVAVGFCGHTLGEEEVLERDRDSVKGACGLAPVETGRICSGGVGLDRSERPDRGVGLLDPGQGCLQQFGGGHGPGPHRFGRLDEAHLCQVGHGIPSFRRAALLRSTTAGRLAPSGRGPRPARCRRPRPSRGR